MIKKIKDWASQGWALGFVRGGMAVIMESEHFEVDWVKMPKDRWFADPFVLDVTADEILLLVEDYSYVKRKGIISLLHIDRNSMDITARKELLELPTHLSFPAIWRKNEHVYVYPESARSGRLDLYEYDAEKEELTFVKTISDDVVWDSYITEAFGEPLMFTAAHDDAILDIYRWNEQEEKFVAWQQVTSDKPNCRMGGAVFEYKGKVFYPAQNCEKAYGGAIDIKRVEFENERVEVLETVKHIESPHPKMPLGMHTMNEYKGVVAIDVKGYRYGMLGAVVTKFVNIKKKFKK